MGRLTELFDTVQNGFNPEYDYLDISADREVIKLLRKDKGIEPTLFDEILPF